MAGVKGRSGRKRQVSQTILEAMGKYQNNIDKLSDELYLMAKNTKLTASVRLQAINVFLEKCVPKVDYKPPERTWIFDAEILKLRAMMFDIAAERQRKLLGEGKNYDPGGSRA